MEGVDVRVVKLLDRARTSEKFEMRDRNPVRSRRKLVLHTAEDALEKLP